MSLTSLTTGISDYATRRAIQQLSHQLTDAAGVTSTLIEEWSTSYSWGNHAGLYDTVGTAAGEVTEHETTYDHTLLHSPLTLGTANGLSLVDQVLSLPVTATPQFAGLTLSGNVVLPNDGWIGSVSDTTAIQITAAGAVNIPGDVTVSGHVIFNSDNSHIGYTDNSPMLVFNNADDRAEVTGGLTISGATAGVGNITTTGGELRSGVEDTTRGYCRLFGQATGNVWGGSLYLGTSADYDTTIDAYILSAYEDDFVIQNGGAGNLFKIAGADNAVTLIGALTTGGTITTDAGDSTEWDAAYDHSLVVSGNPHVVTAADLSLEIGTDVQAYSAKLADIAALTPTDSNIIVGNGTTWVAESGDTARTSLGLGSGDSPSFTGITVSGLEETAVPYIGTGGLVKTEADNLKLVALTYGYSLQINNPSVSSVISADYDGGACSAWLTSYRAAVSGGSFGFRHARGSKASPVVVNSGDNLLALEGWGYGNTAFGIGASIVFRTDAEVPSGNLIPGSIRFNTAPSGTETLRMIIASNGNVGIGNITPAELLEVNGTIRTDDVFNVSGTDGVTQAASAGTVCDVTALAGGIATAQTQVTYATDGTYASPTSITIQNGRITAIS